MKFMKYFILGALALGVQGSVEASAKQHAKSTVEIARQGGAMGFGAFIEHPELAEQSRKKELAGSYKTSPQPVSRGNVDAGEFPSTGYGQATRHSSSHSASPQSAGYAASSPFSSLRSSASTLQHERATTDPHHPDHLRVGDPTAAILGRKPSSSNLSKYEHRVSHTPTAAQVQQSPQRPSFFSNFKSNIQNVRGILQPSYKAKQEVKQAKSRTMSLAHERDQIHAQIKNEGNPDPKKDPRWQAAQDKLLAAKLDEDLKSSLARKSISKQDLQAIQSHGASVDLQRHRLDNLRDIRINDQKIDRLKAAMKKGANSRSEAEKLMKDMADASADDKKYHNEKKQLFAPPAKPAAASMPAPVKPIAITPEQRTKQAETEWKEAMQESFNAMKKGTGTYVARQKEEKAHATYLLAKSVKEGHMSEDEFQKIQGAGLTPHEQEQLIQNRQKVKMIEKQMSDMTGQEALDPKVLQEQKRMLDREFKNAVAAPVQPAPPTKPAAQIPEPVKPVARERETDEQARIRIAKEMGMSPDKVKLDNSSSRPAPGSREAGLTESNFMN